MEFVRSSLCVPVSMIFPLFRTKINEFAKAKTNWFHRRRTGGHNFLDEESGAEADAKKMCDMMCESMDLMKKAMEDPANADLLTDAEELTKEAEKFGKEMEEKYKDNEDGSKDLAAELAKCKCD